MRKILCIILGCSFLFLGHANAAFTPLSVSLVPPIQFPPDDFSITGVRLSVLWGRHRDLYGFDFGGLGNVTDQTFVGTGLSGGFNITHGMVTVVGVQAAAGANINTQKTDVYGAQLALGVNDNTAESSLTGLQIGGIANLSAHTDIYGVEVGLYNKAQDVHGLQIGLVNVAASLHGIQIGLINFNEKGIFAVSPIINLGF